MLLSKRLYVLALASLLLSFSPISHAQSANIVPVLSLLLDEDCPIGSTVTGNQTLSLQSEVDALRGVSKIEGDLILSPTAELDFAVLNHLTEITGDFKFQTNSVQTKLDGFDCLTAIGGDFRIISTNLASVDGFTSLASVDGSFLVFFNDALEVIPGFSALSSVSGPLRITDNTDLKAINGFANLSSLGSLDISDNRNLMTIPDFSALSSVTGTVRITSNAALKVIDGFTALTSVVSLAISTNAALTTITGFTALKLVSAAFAIFDNATLMTITGFTALESVGGDFAIDNHPALATIPNFSALKTVTGLFMVSANAGLASLGGFPLLNSVVGDLTISNNAILTSISGFGELDSRDISGTSTVSNNPMLSCDAPDPQFVPVDASKDNLVNCTTGFNITLEFINLDITATQKQAFQDAAAYWENVIIGDLSDVTIGSSTQSCQGALIPVDTVDDLYIGVDVGPIDGVSGSVGLAGPSRLRSSALPFAGCMTFDSEDLAFLEVRGLLSAVIRHEMGHVLGFGTLWSGFNLIDNPLPDGGLPNLTLPQPEYTGARAVSEWQALGGTGNVPVENGFSNGQPNGAGRGTTNGHWSKGVFGDELMIFSVSNRNPPLSRATIGSLQDMGYTVDYSAADAYSLP